MPDSPVLVPVGEFPPVGPRWLLVGPSAQAGPAVERILDGSARVFGFAGAVTDAPLPGPVPVPCVLSSDPASVERFWASWAGRGPVVPASHAALIASERVSAQVRAVCARRALADDPAYTSRALSAAALEVLRGVAELVVPGSGIDLAARVDARLAEIPDGDGWRPDTLPSDIEAYEAALADLAGPLTDTVLEDVAAGRHPGGRLSGGQLAAWFEDARVDLVTQWVAHPATMARIGYDGLATGGGDVPFLGFASVGP